MRNVALFVLVLTLLSLMSAAPNPASRESGAQGDPAENTLHVVLKVRCL